MKYGLESYVDPSFEKVLMNFSGAPVALGFPPTTHNFFPDIILGDETVPSGETILTKILSSSELFLNSILYFFRLSISFV